MQSLKEVLEKAGVPMTPDEEAKETELEVQRHRSKTVVERPTDAVELQSCYREEFVPKKVQQDPTDDLLEIPVGMCFSELTNWFFEHDNDMTCTRYVVLCKNTQQVWFARTQLILDMNFIYRDDLMIEEIPARQPVESKLYADYASKYNPGLATRKTCYILDSPPTEKYEVYYDTDYPSVRYGKATPNGMFIYRYKNRFHRDMAILMLDELYSGKSKEEAAKLQKKPMAADEAIIISDGCWMRDVCAASCYYLDNTSVIKMTEGLLPAEPEQAVLTSEIVAATNALRLCQLKNKKRITYYYDNTSIVNCLRNRKLEYVPEIKEYKELLKALDVQGFNIQFVEVHPKTGDDRSESNKAIMFFHNYCDKDCREMVDIFKKDYKSIARLDNKEGKSYAQYKQEFKPKRPANNQHTGNNRYGRNH